MGAGHQAREQPPRPRPGASPVVAEHLQQPGREHDVAVLAALALLNADHHAGAVDVGRAQADGFRDAQAGRVAGGQDGAVLGARHAVEELQDFLGAGNDRQLVGLPGGGQDLRDVPVLPERDAVQEAQGGDGDADRTGREFPFGGEEHLVVADLLGAEQRRGPVEMAGELQDLLDVGGLGARGEIAHGHVLRHALAKWCHEESSFVEWNALPWAAASSFRNGSLRASRGVRGE